jgi:iron complex outermembrane receptor protein
MPPAWAASPSPCANLQNLFDRQYWAGAFADNFMTVGAPRTLRLSATVDF